MRRSVLSCGLLLLTKSLLFGVEPRVPAVALAFSPDGDTLLVGGHREVRTYSVARGERKSTFVCEFPKISALAFSPDAGTLAVSGKPTHGYNLIPKSAGSSPFQVATVWIDDADATIRQFEVVEANGLRRQIRLTSFKTNVPVDAAVFVFTPPAGVRVVTR